MSISPDQINRWRGRVVWITRAAAMTMLVLGAYLTLKRILFAIGASDPNVAFRVWGDDFGERNSFYRGVALLVVGGGLAWLATPISRWIITLPPTGCPRCRYARPTAGQSRCPECGLRWSGEEGDGAP